MIRKYRGDPVGALVAEKIVKVALTYALLERSSRIELAHVTAAIAVVQYSSALLDSLLRRASNERVTGRIELKIIRALERKPQGLSRTQIHKDVLKSNFDCRDIDV